MTTFISTNTGFPIRVRAIKDGAPFYDITEGTIYKALKEHHDPRDSTDYFEIEHDDLKDTWDCPVSLFTVVDTYKVTPLTLWQYVKDSLAARFANIRDRILMVLGQ